MKGSRRIYYADSLQHIYQNTYYSGVIFYNVEDYVLLYTLMSTIAKKMNIKIITLCFMINHIHCFVKVINKKELSSFVMRYTSVFVKEYNKNKRRSGPLFKENFGSASKIGSKKIMSTIAYIANNPVLKRLCYRAEEYRWGFLSYAINKTPFSSPIVIRKSSVSLRNSIKIVSSCVDDNLYLNYTLQKELFKKLDFEEKEQLLDYIISSYNVIDYEEMIKYYGCYDKMLIAINSNSGSEYDIKEERDSSSDLVFFKMIEVAENLGYGGKNGFNFQNVKDDALLKLIKDLCNGTGASIYHIEKFLHINISK